MFKIPVGPVSKSGVLKPASSFQTRSERHVFSSHGQDEIGEAWRWGLGRNFKYVSETLLLDHVLIMVICRESAHLW